MNKKGNIMIKLQNIDEIIINIQEILQREEENLVFNFEKIERDRSYRKDRVVIIEKLIHIINELISRKMIENNYKKIVEEMLLKLRYILNDLKSIDQ